MSPKSLFSSFFEEGCSLLPADISAKVTLNLMQKEFEDIEAHKEDARGKYLLARQIDLFLANCQMYKKVHLQSTQRKQKVDSHQSGEISLVQLLDGIQKYKDPPNYHSKAYLLPEVMNARGNRLMSVLGIDYLDLRSARIELSFGDETTSTKGVTTTDLNEMMNNLAKESLELYSHEQDDLGLNKWAIEQLASKSYQFNAED